MTSFSAAPCAFLLWCSEEVGFWLFSYGFTTTDAICNQSATYLIWAIRDVTRIVVHCWARADPDWLWLILLFVLFDKFLMLRRILALVLDELFRVWVVLLLVHYIRSRLGVDHANRIIFITRRGIHRHSSSNCVLLILYLHSGIALTHRCLHWIWLWALHLHSLCLGGECRG